MNLKGITATKVVGGRPLGCEDLHYRHFYKGDQVVATHVFRNKDADPNKNMMFPFPPDLPEKE